MPPDALRIALISEHASPFAAPFRSDAAGQSADLEPLLRALVRRGHCVDVLVRRDSSAWPTVAELLPGVRLLHVDAGPPVPVPPERLLEHMPEFARGATRLVGGGDPHEACDLLHADGYLSGFVGLRLARACRLPLAISFPALGLVQREQVGAAELGPPERVDIERTLVQQADALIAACPQDRADLMRLYGARPSRISTVPRGVDTQFFVPGDKAQARRALGWADDEFIILQRGPLQPCAGIDTAILALARLPRLLRARLVVVGAAGAGAGPERHHVVEVEVQAEVARLRAIAQEAGVTDRVDFTGPRAPHELRSCYVGADVLAATPWHEPVGSAPLEAMACGTPVIGSTVGSIRHAVVPGVSGGLVPPRDPVALAAQLLRLHEHPPLARALGRGGAQRARTLFTWDRVAAELASLYRTLAPAARPQRRRLPAMPPAASCLCATASETP
jgi:D-inositol-3-phosphate glycosyltransferase